MKQELNINATGLVFIKLIKNQSVIFEFKEENLILQNAKKILTRAIGGSDYHIDKIIAYFEGTPLAFVTPLTSEFPGGDDKVRLKGVFDEDSFNGTIDKLELVSINGGVFSQLTDLIITKDDTSKLQIDWLITINQI